VSHLRGGPSALTAGRTMSLSADGRFALSSGGRRLRLSDTVTGEVIGPFDGPSLNVIHTARITADGRYAVSGDHESPMAVWDAHNGRCIRILDDYEQDSYSLALTPDGRFVLAGDRHGNLRRWELDWELAAREAADWDDGAAPYLDAFLRRHGPRWTEEDFDALSRRLQDVGYGWLRGDGVRARLDRMAADQGGSTTDGLRTPS
jgi:hypothetical protein